MKKSLTLAAALLTWGASSVFAQHYDPFFSLNGEAGSKGADVFLSAGDIGSIADAGDLSLMGKMAINDKIEVGVNIGLGVLNDAASSFSTALIGAKYGLGESSAISVNLLAPVGDADDPGLSIGYMDAREMGGTALNTHLQVSLLKGFAAAGANIDLFLEPYKELSDKLILYIDVPIGMNTDDIGNSMNIDLAPNVDYLLSETMVINAGIGLNLYNGVSRSSDIGIALALVAAL